MNHYFNYKSKNQFIQIISLVSSSIIFFYYKYQSNLIAYTIDILAF
jgi:hypothetical protein